MSDDEPSIEEFEEVEDDRRVGPGCFGWILIIGGAIWLLPYIISLIPLALFCVVLYCLYKNFKSKS